MNRVFTPLKITKWISSSKLLVAQVWWLSTNGMMKARHMWPFRPTPVTKIAMFNKVGLGLNSGSRPHVYDLNVHLYVTWTKHAHIYFLIIHLASCQVPHPMNRLLMAPDRPQRIQPQLRLLLLCQPNNLQPTFKIGQSLYQAPVLSFLIYRGYPCS